MPEMTHRDALKRIWHRTDHHTTRSCSYLILRDVDLECMFKVLELADIGLKAVETRQMAGQLKLMEGSSCSDAAPTSRSLPGCGGDNLSD